MHGFQSELEDIANQEIFKFQYGDKLKEKTVLLKQTFQILTVLGLFLVENVLKLRFYGGKNFQRQVLYLVCTICITYHSTSPICHCPNNQQKLFRDRKIRISRFC